MSFYEDLKNAVKNFKAWIKGIFLSWTMWFNGVIASALVMAPTLQDQFPVLQSYLPDSLYKNLMFVIALVNILLRLKTTQSVASKGKNGNA